ncbi:MAG: hypothetical protein ABI885_03695 [Gammaproteobacteria bacterium]
MFENNVVLNTSGWSIRIRADGPGPWIIRNNTILLAADPTDRAGTGQSSAEGTPLHLTGRAVALVHSNIHARGNGRPCVLPRLRLEQGARSLPGDAAR